MPKDGEDDNILQPRKTINEMPRHKIAKDNACFDTLFSLLDLHKEVQLECNQLVNMLCTRPETLWDLMWLDDRPPEYPKINWRDTFHEESMQKTQYALGILESLITSNINYINPNAYEY
jgi:hypothetical protein